ncbi:hypothetical protein HOP62_13585 [Halomonas sp. MCCC 1A17488]|uniref:Uncharacterized protein n=1 Tax=Billgrantia sulfidoxydans TaxID=2733484 RepID=A0ABX7W0Q8_9GAMM|nr:MULTISPECIES: hypothetical protein [Halomonas]MCE8017105.1 hypothetical protein [Halomonas sp. MCCC 1A17488]MCG3240438.1 hypothetical protein [Halomonas sp. MCCC 1A17488]QPP49699.1 hypothetical protein I4484_00765 [Halomonas sp. SS10-MC5]QTP53310.1 hypothetical protein HNO51_00630 [Halomonas sulfidoxydans]
MRRHLQASAWLGGSLATLAFSAALAAEGPAGYRSADFGMAFDEVMTELERDAAVANLSVSETEDGDRLIDGELQDEAAPQTDLRYVFPAGSDALALVVAFHPEVEDYVTVKAQLEARYGQPWEAEMTEWWFEQLKGGMPQEPSSLTVWGGDGSEDTERGRFVRLWSFEDYLTVEYLDTQLFPR